MCNFDFFVYIVSVLNNINDLSALRDILAFMLSHNLSYGFILAYYSFMETDTGIMALSSKNNLSNLN